MEFICSKTEVREILEYHQLKCSDSVGYSKISDFLDTMPDSFLYNDFCGKLEEIIRHGNGKLIDMGDQFKRGLIERMRRYKLGGDLKDLNAKLPKMTRGKRLRKERKEKYSQIIIKNNDGLISE
jgi:hypothetical protein